MFDIGAQEILLIMIVAILVIGPKDMPAALRAGGRWIGKMRRMSGHFRSGLDSVIREAEMEDMEKKWKEQNKKIMSEYPDGAPSDMEPTGALPSPAPSPTPSPAPSTPAPASAEAAKPPATPTATPSAAAKKAD